MRTKTILIIAFAGAILGLQEEAQPGQNAERYAQIHHHPAGPVVAVAEGDGEPRSVGSYSV